MEISQKQIPSRTRNGFVWGSRLWDVHSIDISMSKSLTLLCLCLRRRGADKQAFPDAVCEAERHVDGLRGVHRKVSEYRSVMERLSNGVVWEAARRRPTVPKTKTSTGMK